MAIAINDIPVLTGETAEQFEKNAKLNLSLKSSIDFSKEINLAKSILKRARI